MKKDVRHSKILELISKMNIETQDDLVSELNKLGFNVTQSTVSRDIRELHLTKVSTSEGTQKYIHSVKSDEELNDKYIRVLKDGYISIEQAYGLVVVKTVPGMAMAVAAAIDAIKFKEIIGSIAGDDTIMCAVKSLDDGKHVIESLKKILNK